MNESISGQLADARSEHLASLEALQLQARRPAKAAPLAWHHGNLKAAARRQLPRAIFDYVEDGGVRSGLDVLKALGLGAKACLIGRAYAYGLAAYGQAG